MSAVAIREDMDLHQSVMEASSDFVDRKSLVVDPILRVSEELSGLSRDLRPVDADILS
jgi:hypothetical protein